jgi:hypothetical protein
LSVRYQAGMEIPLRRKYTEVTHGRFRSQQSVTGISRARMPMHPADKELADADRRRPRKVMVLLPNGKKRMMSWPVHRR